MDAYRTDFTYRGYEISFELTEKMAVECSALFNVENGPLTRHTRCWWLRPSATAEEAILTWAKKASNREKETAQGVKGLSKGNYQDRFATNSNNSTSVLLDTFAPDED